VHQHNPGERGERSSTAVCIAQRPADGSHRRQRLVILGHMLKAEWLTFPGSSVN
jgi:hypothetical protein